MTGRCTADLLPCPAFETLISPVDKAVLSGELGAFLASSIKEGIRPGHKGCKEDDLAFVSDWGFSPSDVSVPLLLWQGKEDIMVPFAHGLWLAGHIPGVEAHLSSEDGHLTLFERVSETHAWLLRHFWAFLMKNIWIIGSSL